MPQSTETIDELRARLKNLAGPARAHLLAPLAQKLFQRAMNTPLESMAARADIDEAIRCADEVYRYHREDDPQRPQVAAFLGFMLVFREGQVSGESHRQRAVALFEEAIERGRFPVSYLATLRLVLAMQLITGSQERLTSMVSLSPIDMMAGRRSPAAVPDLDRAEQLLGTVRDTAGVSADIMEMADVLLRTAEMMKTLLGIGTRPMDMSAMQDMVSRMVELQGRFQSGSASVVGLMRKAFEPGAGVLDVPREEVPPLILEGAVDEVRDQPREQAPAVAPTQPEQRDLLRALVTSLSLDQDGRSAWSSTAQLLLPGSETYDIETVDNAVALASEVLAAEDRGLSDEDRALAYFVYATALCLRQRADSTGDGSDYEAGAQALLSAVRALPADHPEVPVVLRSLGAFLTPERPLAGLAVLAAGFTGRLDAVLATGNLSADRRAELHALRCTCRVAFAAAELRNAVDELPGDYPWPVSLKAAAQVLG